MAPVLIAHPAGDRGIAMVTALSVTLAVFAVVGTVIRFGTHQEAASASARRRAEALAAAEAGVAAAMSRLAVNADYAGADLETLSSARAQYSVAVARLSPDPADDRRGIVSIGYAPSRANPRSAVRRVEQDVSLVPTSGFTYALFTATGGIAGANNATVNGDVYSHTDLTLANQVKIAGSVTTLGALTTTANTTIGGDVRAAGGVTLDNSSTTVLGSLYSGGAVRMTGRVDGNVQAAGAVTVERSGSVGGSATPNAPPEPPRAQRLPTFTWDPANYASPRTWSGPPEFGSYWNASVGAFSGHHRITCGSTCPSINLDRRWTLAGDATIVTDGAITLSRDMANGAGRPVTLTIVALSATSPAITLSNNLTLPPDVRVVLYAPNAEVRFTNLTSFSGAVYSKSLSLAQQFTITHVPVSVPGFTWDLASSNRFRILAGNLSEVPA